MALEYKKISALPQTTTVNSGDEIVLNQSGTTYRLNVDNFPSDATTLQGNPVSTATPTTGYALVWNGSSWSPASVAGGGGDMLKSTYDTSGVDGIVDDADNSRQLSSDGGSSNVVTASQARAHIDNADAHRLINDSGTGTTDLWSANRITSAISSAGGGDMLKSVYDTNDNDVVDSAEAVEGVATAGNDKYYGTNTSGTPGFYDLPSGGGGPTTPGTTVTGNVAAWGDTSGGSLTDSGVAAGDAISLRGDDIDVAISPADGEVLTWNGTATQWESQAPSGGSGPTTPGTTVTGNVAAWGDTSGGSLTDSGVAAGDAVKLHGFDVVSWPPSTGQALVYDASTSQYEPQYIRNVVYYNKASGSVTGNLLSGSAIELFTYPSGGYMVHISAYSDDGRVIEGYVNNDSGTGILNWPASNVYESYYSSPPAVGYLNATSYGLLYFSFSMSVKMYGGFPSGISWVYVATLIGYQYP